MERLLGRGESLIFKFCHLNLILLLETCFKVLMKEIKIGKAVETLDGKNQTAKSDS